MEYVATIGGVGLYTVFTPWFGLVMILVFSFWLDIFPIGKFIDPMVWLNAPDHLHANELFIQLLYSALAVSAVLIGWLAFTSRFDPLRRVRMWWSGVVVIVGSALAYWVFFSGGALPYAWDIARHLILPIITLTLISFAGQMLLTRNSMLETLREDYIMTARAKGLPEKVVRDKHAARNALLPVVTAFVFALAFALDGGVITETVFSWPGMGLTLLAAAQTEDIPMAIGALVFTGALALTAHLIADILYAFLDPRIRYT